jgi:hypothetical protein
LGAAGGNFGTAEESEIDVNVDGGMIGIGELMSG